MRPDPAMLGAPGADRFVNDSYHTIDPRCVGHLAKVWPLRDRPIVEPCAGRGDMIAELEAHGAVLLHASDLYAYPDADTRIITGIDVFDRKPDWADMMNGLTVITNPPYTHLRQVVAHLLDVAPGAWVVILCRSSQMHVQAMQPMLTGGRLWAVAPLPFRPYWHAPHPGEAHKNSPRHEYAWFIWSPIWAIVGEPKMLFARTPPPPERPLQQPLSQDALWWRGLPREQRNTRRKDCP